ncbi:MAG: ACP S-malonyltransferase [Pseudomonadota bacterium]|nr:hypothetical protein [Gammaproteobacteria bacterium]MEE2683597.1 ACP S-malonyltransferase [Pseudomonadota bacterium]
MVRKSKNYYKEDKEGRVIYIFPGQGCQYKGMGSDIIEEFSIAREIYDQASDVLGYDMIELSINDPENKLDKTEFTQPALLTHEIACMESMLSLVSDSEDVRPHLAMGHSLGEYSALVATDTLSFEQALRLVKKRAEIMSRYSRGSMVATNLDFVTAKRLAASTYLSVAAHNSENQTVLAGDTGAIDLFLNIIDLSNRKIRAVQLNTEGPFHSHLMAPAAEEFYKELLNTDFGIRFMDDLPQPSIIANHTAEIHPFFQEEARTLTEAAIKNSHDKYEDYFHGRIEESIRSTLYFQIFNPVLWLDSIKRAIEEEPIFFIEFGGGIGKDDGPENKRPNLMSMNKKIIMSENKDIEYLASINKESIVSTSEKLNNLDFGD